MIETQSAPTAPPEIRQVSASRLAWVDLVRAGGAFLVVLAHVVLYPAIKGSGPLWAQTLYYASTRVAVPLFFMVSGFLLLGRQEPLGTFFRKRALRVFVPFLIWSYIYLAWAGGFASAGFTPAGLLGGLRRIIAGPRAAHLWFFYVLIGLYLVAPVLRALVSRAHLRELAYFCGMWFLLDPGLSAVKHITGLEIGFEFQFFTGYIGYFMLGYLLGQVILSRRAAVASLAILIASFAVVFLTVYFGQQQPKYDQFYEGYLSVPVVLMTASTFYLLRYWNGYIPERLARWILPVSSASFGIYLLHIIVLDMFGIWLPGIAPVLRTGTTLLVMPLVALMGYAVCFLVIWALQKIPILKYGVP